MLRVKAHRAKSVRRLVFLPQMPIMTCMKFAGKRWLYLAMFVLLCNACGGQLYRVATPPKVAAPALPAEAPDQATALVVAARLLSGDELIEQFEANLLLAGVIVVDFRATNRTNTTQVVNYVLQDASGLAFKPLLPPQTLQRVMRFYGNRLYAKAAYQKTLAQYEAVALSQPLALDPQKERRGFLYFATTADATALRGLRLTAEGVTPPLTINLN